MKEKIKMLKKNSKIYLASLILVLLHFGIDYSLEYATDSYATFNEKGTWWYSLFESGRPLKALIYYVLEELNVSGAICYHMSWLLGIITLTASVAILAILMKRYIKSELLSVMIAFLTLANPFIIELMIFEEKGLFMLTIFLSVVAVCITEKNWRDFGKMGGTGRPTYPIMSYFCSANISDQCADLCNSVFAAFNDLESKHQGFYCT